MQILGLKNGRKMKFFNLNLKRHKQAENTLKNKCPILSGKKNNEILENRKSLQKLKGQSKNWGVRL